MDKYLWKSSFYVVLFIVFFYFLWNGILSGTLGRFNIFLMILFPLMGIFSVRKSPGGLGKIVLIILHIIAICIIGFLLLLGFGMGEK
ncbi:hypothetical protein [Bacillus sp. FJAT-27245]|uniref:hypothetical protein n=1 Tax=Bacillus sp. FJAT-27245 TaxID=1684144 RepID=UPI0006A7B4AC|nr:hypothetical protein [Bacillus sp. FJAT-27245]